MGLILIVLKHIAKTALTVVVMATFYNKIAFMEPV